MRNDQDVFNLYVSRFDNGLWSSPDKLNNNINSNYAETHACISDDGMTLYFTSNRPGGYGGFDIYKSTINSEGKWQEAVNLGPKINTPFDETTPFITEDGQTLYFSSKGHYNIGGYDIFFAKKNGENWSDPENLGFPFNTTDDDVFFFPLKNGSVAYYSKYKETGYGDNDIYRIQILERENIPEKEKELEEQKQLNSVD